MPLFVGIPALFGKTVLDHIACVLGTAVSSVNLSNTKPPTQTFLGVCNALLPHECLLGRVVKFLFHFSQIPAGAHAKIIGEPISAFEVKVLESQTHTYKLGRVRYVAKVMVEEKQWKCGSVGVGGGKTIEMWRRLENN